MSIIPEKLKPSAHRCLNWLAASRKLFLPEYFNLTVKSRYILHGIDEPDIRYVADKFLSKGDVVIDVGANVGLTARAFANAVGETGCIHAIEPERMNFNYLCANMLDFPNVVTHRCAFAADSGTRKLCLNSISGTGNSLFGEAEDVVQKITCFTFDEFCENEEICHIDCIKIDVEGAEIEVLKGMGTTFSRFPNLLLLVELCPVNLERAGRSGQELVDFLTECAFDLYVIEESKGSFSIKKEARPMNSLGSRPYINLLCSKRALV